ncbi:MAG TPA: VOC family protein [Verrucomicrobiae bacterium]|jgi:predicted 3-demethylubiquinone-9 3-methyltransferase (glyoxalase superfamily)|nr:VOC family protein [Verrucomicrobiae bacterium]
MHKITPFLWFDNNLEEAMDFYVTVFKNTKIGNVARAGENGPVISATFEIEGQEFKALNGGPQFKFNEAISFFVNCENQEEVDELWQKLSDGGEERQCGWVQDKFGLFWQIIPTALGEMLGDPDPEKSKRARDAMLQMHKIDIAALRRAYNQQ